MSRAVCLLALAGCFVPRTAAEKPRTRVYNALSIVGGAAAIPAGYEIVRAMDNTDGLGPFIGAMFGGGGMAAGAMFILGGITGLVLDGLDFTPTH